MNNINFIIKTDANNYFNNCIQYFFPSNCGQLNIYIFLKENVRDTLWPNN